MRQHIERMLIIEKSIDAIADRILYFILVTDPGSEGRVLLNALFQLLYSGKQLRLGSFKTLVVACVLSSLNDTHDRG
jgi:hypothetical protein